MITRALVLVTTIFTLFGVTGCSDAKPQPPNNTDGEFADGNTHSGGVAVEVYNSYINAFRHGQGDITCSFVTVKMQARVAREGRALSGKTLGCSAAVTDRFKAGDVPAAPSEMTVKKAVDDLTTLSVSHRDGSVLSVALVEEQGHWLIDDITSVSSTPDNDSAPKPAN